MTTVQLGIKIKDLALKRGWIENHLSIQIYESENRISIKLFEFNNYYDRLRHKFNDNELSKYVMEILHNEFYNKLKPDTCFNINFKGAYLENHYGLWRDCINWL